MTVLYVALGIVCAVITAALVIIGLVVIVFAVVLLRAVWEGVTEPVDGRAVG